jgi:hypothetical protein
LDALKLKLSDVNDGNFNAVLGDCVTASNVPDVFGVCEDAELQLETRVKGSSSLGAILMLKEKLFFFICICIDVGKFLCDW